MRPFLRGVGAHAAVQTGCLAGGAEEREQRGGDCDHEQHPVAPLWRAHPHLAHAQPEAQVLEVAEALLDAGPGRQPHRPAWHFS